MDGDQMANTGAEALIAKPVLRGSREGDGSAAPRPKVVRWFVIVGLLLVLLLGLGGPQASFAVAAYFVAHALYKAALFLVTGSLEKATGTRHVDELGGLRDHMTITFISAALAALSDYDGSHPEPTARRTELVAAAGQALWCFMVQREACGLRDSRTVLRDYRVPVEVQNRMGIFPGRGRPAA